MEHKLLLGNIIADYIEKDFGFRREKCLDLALQFFQDKSDEDLPVARLLDFYTEIKKKIEVGELL